MIKVDWFFIKNKHDPEWDRTNCLYAYLKIEDSEILYVGKAYGEKTSVRDRFKAEDKQKLWDDLEKKRGITKVYVLVGELHLPEDQNLTEELLKDIETLLIYEEDPWGNIMGKETRTSRPGMIVKCIGSWPGRRKYVDE